MGEPPPLLDGARVLRFAVVDTAVAPTGATVHRVGGQVVGPGAALAICRYDEDGQFYLFSCAEGWRVVTDTCHASLEEALAQAEFEYRGVSACWQEVGA